MYLSAFQKEIVKKIAEDKIKTIEDFIVEFNLVDPDAEKITKDIGGGISMVCETDFSIADKHYKILDNETAFEKLIDFRKVINLLTKAELIEIEEIVDMEILRGVF
jgi:hypothetical protein